MKKIKISLFISFERVLTQ